MTVADDSPVMYNPLQPGYVENPFAHFAEMREHEPVHNILGTRWALFCYDDVFDLLRDPSLSVDDRKLAVVDQERINMFGEDTSPNTSILNIDPPDHTRLRRLVSKAFTARTIDGLRPLTERLVAEALDRIASAGGGDLVAELAFPLPFDVISEMLGMPESDKDLISEWSAALVKTLDPIIDEEAALAAVDASVKMDAHIDAVVEWKRANPADDLLTKMIEAEEDGDRMSSIELRDQVSLLFVAGHETTVNLIGTGIYELLKRPDQLELLRSRPDLDANAVDELLRFVSPVQLSRRIATRPLEYGGIEIPAGWMVMAGLASANHDPDKFGPTAEELDIERENAGQHVSFGSGAHYCLGAQLAKLEARIAIGETIRRFESMRVVEAEWNGRINLRGLERLVVEV